MKKWALREELPKSLALPLEQTKRAPVVVVERLMRPLKQ
jgi:hypothetical protein